MIKENIYKKLSKEVIKDDLVKIDIAFLLEGGSRQSFYATSLAPGQLITPHYHKVGAEVYYIISGHGIMHIKNTNSENKVYSGDIFRIDPNVIHQLENNSTEEPLILLFICDPSHLSHDRFVVTK